MYPLGLPQHLIYLSFQCHYKTVATCTAHSVVTTAPYINTDAQHSSNERPAASPPLSPHVFHRLLTCTVCLQLFWDPAADFELRLWRKGWCWEPPFHHNPRLRGRFSLVLSQEVWAIMSPLEPQCLSSGSLVSICPWLGGIRDWTTGCLALKGGVNLRGVVVQNMALCIVTNISTIDCM